jgi:hypothetical protein
MTTFHTASPLDCCVEGKDQAGVADAWLEPDSRVANLGCADELERDPMGLGQREEQLEARLARARASPP